MVGKGGFDSRSTWSGRTDPYSLQELRRPGNLPACHRRGAGYRTATGWAGIVPLRRFGYATGLPGEIIGVELVRRVALRDSFHSVKLERNCFYVARFNCSDRAGRDCARRCACVDRHVQRAGHLAEPLQERLLADRRAAEAALRPDSESGRGGQGLHQARARDARSGDHRPATRPTRPASRPPAAPATRRP